MKKLLSSLTFGFGLMAMSSMAYAGGAIICKSDSTGKCAGRQYCCYNGSQSDGDKYCKKLGCRRGGTGSCPTAANVKSCGTRDKGSVEPDVKQKTELDLPWCIAPKDAAVL